jgi:hypothetical protein
LATLWPLLVLSATKCYKCSTSTNQDCANPIDKVTDYCTSTSGAEINCLSYTYSLSKYRVPTHFLVYLRPHCPCSRRSQHYVSRMQDPWRQLRWRQKRRLHRKQGTTRLYLVSTRSVHQCVIATQITNCINYSFVYCNKIFQLM